LTKENAGQERHAMQTLMKPGRSPNPQDPELLRLNAFTEKVIGCAYQVSNTLGVGFLEKVYENALLYELKKAGLRVEQQCPLKVYYDGIEVGEYFADLLVESSVLVELKASREIDEVFMAQCINYLKATGLSVCLLINFGTSRIGIKRVVI
jgi:GxxExxY protein